MAHGSPSDKSPKTWRMRASHGAIDASAVCHCLRRKGKRSTSRTAARHYRSHAQESKQCLWTNRTSTHSRAATHALRGDLGEVFEQPQPGGLTLLRMKLHRVKIIAPHTRTERQRVFRVGRNHRSVPRHNIIRVHKVKV